MPFAFMDDCNIKLITQFLNINKKLITNKAEVEIKAIKATIKYWLNFDTLYIIIYIYIK